MFKPGIRDFLEGDGAIWPGNYPGDPIILLRSWWCIFPFSIEEVLFVGDEILWSDTNLVYVFGL